MVKKSIAMALLVVMVAWAEMALAPMLVMHAWHMHSAREISEHAAAHHHAMAADHPCCPKIGKTGNAPPLEFAASGLPCQDEHRLCLLQGSHNVPAPVSAGRPLSQEIAIAEIAESTPAQADSHVSPMTAVAPGPPPGLLDMVLRV
jgi:hypothetical protein